MVGTVLGSVQLKKLTFLVVLYSKYYAHLKGVEFDYIKVFLCIEQYKNTSRQQKTITFHS